ncbi:MAG: UTP--glucose-1-phosphate uridylyltransferase [Dehalococcoidia bacterium]
MAITTAVILAAGLGTRLLPATKAVPKEMLPVIDKPLIQYAVEEVAAAGITEVVFVVADGKEAIADHFGSSGRVEAALREKGDEQALAVAAAPARLANFHYVVQDRPLGIAHAVACAREYVEGQAFALVFPDDLIISRRPCVAQLLDAYAACAGSVIAVHEVAEEDIPQYGIVDPVGTGNPARLRGLVEKPLASEAPSNLGIVGRYILSPTILKHIDNTVPGKNGERQITDALIGQLMAGEPVCSYRFEGERFDTGRPAGLLLAALRAGLERPDIRAALWPLLRQAAAAEVH